MPPTGAALRDGAAAAAGAAVPLERAVRTRWLRIAAVAAACFGVTALGVEWTRLSGGHATIWPANALLVAALLRSGRQERHPLLAAGLAAVFAANLTFGGMPWALAAGLALANLAEVATAALLAARLRLGAGCLERLRDAGTLLAVAGGVAPLVGASLGTLVLALAAGAPAWPAWQAWWAADVVGMLVFLPFFLLLAGWRLRPLLRPRTGLEAGLALLCTVGATAIALGHREQVALFLIVPFLTWVAVRLPPLACATALAAVTLLATAATMQGIGPLGADPELPGAEKVELLQVAIGTLAVPLLAIAILLGEQAQMRQALALSEERYRTMYEISPAMLHSTDAQNRLVAVNRAWLDALGYGDQAEVLGRPITDFLSAESRERALRRKLPGFLQAGEVRGLEYRFLRKDGSALDVLLTAVAERDEGGGFVRGQTAMTDITPHKDEENRRLRRMLEELQRANAELEQFTHVAAHDLQEPLRMVASFCELLRQRYEGRLDREADEFIGFAVAGARRMQALINGLLAYARVRSQGAPLLPTPAEAALERALAALAPELAESGGEVTRDALPEVRADAEQLAELFRQLLDNAIKFRTAEPPRINVSATRDGEIWRFTICDNGMGIPERHRQRVFQIFQRLHGREAYPGTGIGLALCSRIVHRHGGELWVDSTSGEGSAFCFTLAAVDGSAHG